MRVDILSLFPEFFNGPLNVSLMKKAREKGVLDVNCIDIRDFTTDKHRCVDDAPYGGGPGMVLKAQPVADAIDSCRSGNERVIYLSPQGRTLRASLCEELAQFEHLILLCGHYEGVDQRVIDSHVDEEVSIGDYVLTSGCLPSLVLLDATCRFLPGMLGNPESAARDSHQKGELAPPQYTRPDEFNGQRVPQVLLNGNHAEIAAWRRSKASAKQAQKERQ